MTWPEILCCLNILSRAQESSSSQTSIANKQSHLGNFILKYLHNYTPLISNQFQLHILILRHSTSWELDHYLLTLLHSLQKNMVIKRHSESTSWKKKVVNTIKRLFPKSNNNNKKTLSKCPSLTKLKQRQFKFANFSDRSISVMRGR